MSDLTNKEDTVPQFEELPDAPPRRRIQLSWSGKIGACTILFWIVIIFIGPLIAPYHEAASAEWQRKQQLDKIIWPGMSLTSRKSKLATAQSNKIIYRMSRMWHALADMLKDGGPESSGRVTWRAFEDEDGARHKAMTVAWLNTIKDGWTAPTLHIDATLRVDLVRHIFPQIELLDRVMATAPHQNTVQYVGKSFSKGIIPAPIKSAVLQLADPLLKAAKTITVV